ncbi:MAG: hypothetical protein WBC44_05960 [Planctomycetaceae bacterium]
MTKRVLSVGQCMPDGMAIKAFLGQQFTATVQSSETADDAMVMLHNGSYDLILVNRVFDADGSSGLDLIKAIKASATTSKIPVMLVSNFDDAQQKAVELGAEPGFGKEDLGAEPLVQRLRPFLESSADEDDAESS